MRRLFFLLISFSFFFLNGCSSSTEELKKEDEIKKEEYVFDAPAADTASLKPEVKNELPPVETAKKFIVQIGAFSTKDRADEYAEKARKKTSINISVSYSDEFKLFVVQLPPFATKSEAQTERDALWKTKDFKDAFIVVLP